MQHARLSPSSSSRWLNCTASVKASEAYENKGNAASIFGTNCHYIGEQLLKGEVIQVGDTLTEDGVQFTVDEELLDVATEYKDYCMSLFTENSIMIVEKQFDLSSVSPNQFGTSDCTILDGTHLHVIDLKTGHNIVNAERNTQLMLYAVGAIDYLESEGEFIEEVTLHIAQGRANHYDSWTCEYDDIIGFKLHAKEVAKRILEDDVTFNPSEKACKWCPHKVHCEALTAHVNEVVTAGFDDLTDIDGNADKVSNEHIKKILDNEDLIISFIKAVKDVALEKLNLGEEIEGYKLVRSRKHKAWSDKEKAEAYLVRKLKKQGAYKQTLITPTQAIKALGKDGAEYIEKFITVPEGDVVLAPQSDKRPSVNAGIDCFDDLD